MTDETYVSNEAWLGNAGRPDLIDEVADQFERPAAPGAESYWSQRQDARWPRGSRGWHSLARRHPANLERRAG